MSYESEMQAALIADGEKLRAMTGEDHGPWDFDEGKWQVCPHSNYMSEDCGTGEPPIQIIDGKGNTIACNTTFYPTAITAKHAETIVSAVNEVAELRAQLAIAIAERDHWKANHAEMVQRNAVLRERPDLPVDRLPAIARYEAELREARMQALASDGQAHEALARGTTAEAQLATLRADGEWLGQWERVHHNRISNVHDAYRIRDIACRMVQP